MFIYPTIYIALLHLALYPGNWEKGMPGSAQANSTNIYGTWTDIVQGQGLRYISVPLLTAAL